jgi:hypothetical protein
MTKAIHGGRQYSNEIRRELHHTGDTEQLYIEKCPPVSFCGARAHDHVHIALLIPQRHKGDLGAAGPLAVRDELRYVQQPPIELGTDLDTV